MNDVFFEERYALMRGRIQEIQKEEVVKEPYGEYFRKTAEFILMVDRLHDKIQKGWLNNASQKELKKIIMLCIRIFCLKIMALLMEILLMHRACWEKFSWCLFGINQGLLPILGYNYGAKLFPRVKEALFKGIFAATVVCVLNFLAIQFLSKYFIIIFNDKPELLNIASRGLRIQTFMLPIIGFQIVSSIYFQAIGKPKMSMFMGLSRQIIILIPCIIIFGKIL